MCLVGGSTTLVRARVEANLPRKRGAAAAGYDKVGAASVGWRRFMIHCEKAKLWPSTMGWGVRGPRVGAGRVIGTARRRQLGWQVGVLRSSRTGNAPSANAGQPFLCPTSAPPPAGLDALPGPRVHCGGAACGLRRRQVPGHRRCVWTRRRVAARTCVRVCVCVLVCVRAARSGGRLRGRRRDRAGGAGQSRRGVQGQRGLARGCRCYALPRAG